MTRPRGTESRSEQPAAEVDKKEEFRKLMRKLGPEYSSKSKKWAGVARVIARLKNSPGNQFTANLAVLAYSTGSPEFVDALDKLIELRLDGPDWEDRLGPQLRRHVMEYELWGLVTHYDGPSIIDAICAFGDGKSQRGVARDLAVSFYESNSYGAAVQAVRKWLRTGHEFPTRSLLRLLNEIPIGQRRKALGYARANRMIAAGHKIGALEALDVIKDVLKAHHKVDDKGLAKIVRAEQLGQE